MKYIGPNISFIFTKIKELMNSHNTDNSAHSELFKSWKRLRNPNNADIADALAATYKNGIGDVLVEVKDDTTFALEDIKLFFRPASFKLISANDSLYEGIYITMDGTQGRYVAKTFADSEIMTPEGPSTISTPSELALYPAASDAVLYTPQTLTEAQQKQARDNIGALDVNIKTTPVDIGVGLGSRIYYVQSGWLRPCPDNADNELKLQYRRVFEFIGSQAFNPNSQDILLQAKSAYALYQKGLASESIKVTKNPLNAAQVYVTWDITTRSNKHYFYYAQVSPAYLYDCTYCVEDDALTSERYQRAIYSTSTGVGEQDSVSQFRMYTNPTEDMHIATKQYVDIAKTEAQQLGLTAATPGKTIKVKTVQDGKPTEWEAVDMPSQPDWNQNDETAPDYVKNRPFYTGNPVETVLVEESTVAFAKNSQGFYTGQLSSTFVPTVGETYKVSWDGAVYECTCVKFGNKPTIGNLSIIGAVSDTGEPFIISIFNVGRIDIATQNTSASHTFSISGFTPEVVKIDPKYLPENVATKQYVDTTKTEAQQLGLTAATPGQIIKVKTVQDGKPTEWEAVDDRLPKVSVSDAGNVLGVEQIGEHEYGYALTHMPTLNDFIPLGITNASPGQFAKVSFVDDFGNPTAWEAADIYEKPTEGIPKTDLAQSVQTSLDKADTSISYDSQTLTEEQKLQARTNIGAGQPVFVVNVTGTPDDNYTADKTAAEIEAAYQAGCTIVCRVVVPLLFNNIPAELPLKSRMQERVFIFAFDQLVKKEIYTITVQISDSGVEPSFVSADIYEKPTSGIPKSDLADDVQTSLAKADNAILCTPQSLTDEIQEQARTNIGAYTKPASGIPKSDLAEDVQTSLDNAMQQDGGTYSNYIKATTTGGVILLQNEMRVGVLSTGCVNISKTQINFYNKSGHLGLSVDASTIRNLATPSDDTDAANKQYVDAAKTEALQLGLTAATPGKTIKVKTVQNGKPTEWETANIYEKPTSGIPKSDLSADVQKTLDNANATTETGVGLIKYIKMVDADTTGSGIVVPDNSNETYYTIKQYINSDYTVILVYKGVPYSLNYTKVVNNSISLYYFHAIVSSDATSTVDTASEIKTVVAGNNFQFKVTTKPLYISATVSNNTLIIR